MMDLNRNRDVQNEQEEEGGGGEHGGDSDNNENGEGDGAVPADQAVGEGDEDEVMDNSDEMPYENWALRPADEPLPESVLHVMAQVFQNDMLVENILEKIILDNDRASIRSCRLVSKQWLCAIAKLYRKMKMPQFIVNTNRDNTLDPRPPRPFFEQHTLLLEFIKPMVRHDRIEGFIPTFSLTLSASYFRKSNYADFVNCLVQCGPSLVELYIRFPKNSAMSFLLPPTITLPNLNTFGVAFSGQSLLSHNFPMPTFHHQHDYFPNNCSIHLVQTILNASTNLRRLQFMHCHNPMNPPDMENLYLPDSLTSISIDTPFRDFELFLRKGLPYLSEIRINATVALYSEETIYDLFSKLSPTLRTVWLTGSAGTRRSLPIRLPRMENVTKFVMFKPWEFEERNPPTSFEETFPLLETLVFANQTEYSFSYLMSGMRSTTVTSFCVWLTSLRPQPPVMNFPPVGLPVGDDQIPNPIPFIQPLFQREPPGALLQERIRHEINLQQMRLDLMERRNRRRQQQPPGDGARPAAAAVDPPANGEGRLQAPLRVIVAAHRQRPRPAPVDNNEAVDINRGEQNNGDDPWRHDHPGFGELLGQRHRLFARRARIAMEFRQQLRERHVGLHAPGDGGVARDEFDPNMGPYPNARRLAINLNRPANMAVVIERVRPPAAMLQPPRVVIRRLGEDRGPGPAPREEAQPEPNNGVPVPEGDNGGPVIVRPNMPNPIRAVYQRMVDRMEVDREEDDNAIHRVAAGENEDDSSNSEDERLHEIFVDRLHEQRNANLNANARAAEARDDANANANVGGVRRLEVLAAAAVANHAEAEDVARVPVPEEPQQEDVPPPLPPRDAVIQLNEAVQEAFRVIREINDPVPENDNVAGANNNNDARPGPARAREQDRDEGGVDQLRAAIGGARRRLRQQEARNLRDLRQLRQRMLLEWANPRGHRHLGAGAAGIPGLHVPLPERPVTMTKEKMQSINLAFPNLVKLTINISGPETCGLKYIFEEMRSLQSLRIIVENSLWTIKWDSLLTGIPADFCDAVRSSTELWDEVYLNENHVSIRNLTKLEELMLLECIKVDEQRDQHRTLDEHYISDVAFHFGMLKMKELKHITVTPGFAPSTAMNKKWYEEKGYKIKARPRARLDVSYYEWH